MNALSVSCLAMLSVTLAGILPRGCSSAPEPVAKTSPPVISDPAPDDAPDANAEPDPQAIDPLVPPIVTLPVGWKEQIGNPDILIDPDFDGYDFTSDLRAHFHAHGNEVCASGCAASRHPTPNLSVEEFQNLLLDYAREPIDAESPSLESLLFHGRQVLSLLGKHGSYPLSTEHEQFLRTELSRTHALIAFRLVDEHGVIRTEMPPTRVPLDRRHEFEMEQVRLPPLETSGTVKRVGLHHLWTRI